MTVTVRGVTVILKHKVEHNLTVVLVLALIVVAMNVKRTTGQEICMKVQVLAHLGQVAVDDV